MGGPPVRTGSWLFSHSTQQASHVQLVHFSPESSQYLKCVLTKQMSKHAFLQFWSLFMNSRALAALTIEKGKATLLQLFQALDLRFKLGDRLL
jgi:hypothetical protein